MSSHPQATPYLSSGAVSSDAGGRVPGVLVTADGRQFRGWSFGADRPALGEVVFTTGMTGYQETLTDPSYHRQIVAMTAPHIGNTGMNDEDDESRKIWVAGLVVRDLSPVASSWRARRTLDAALTDAGVPGLAGIDTRALTRHIRSAGAMPAGIFTGDDARLPGDELAEQVRAQPGMAGADLSADVTTSASYRVPAVGERRGTVVALDLGIKSMTPRRLAERGLETVVVPLDTSLDELLALDPEGVFVSNGPGDPATAERAVALVREVLERGIPFFGICFGNQILGRALGLDTYKLTFGHRGINQPVRDARSGRVQITAHNHGFAVEAPLGKPFDTPFGRAEVSHVCLNDDVVEGLRLLDAPAFSVQYHPEAAAGPHDADALFDEFATMIEGANHATA